MASPRSIEVKVGILILTATALLAGFILVMGGINFQPTYALFVDFDNPGGLQTGAPVKIAGVKVGKITEVQFRGGEIPGGAGKRDPLVRVKVEVEKRYQPSVRDNAVFYVTSSSVLGEQFLALDPGSGDRPVLAENAIVRGLDPPRLDMLIAKAYDLLDTTVNALSGNKDEIGTALNGLSRTLKGTGDFFDKNGERLDRIAANVEQITVDTQDTVREAKQKYVENPQIDRILDNVDRTTGALAKDAPPLLADAKATLANVKRVSETVGGEGEQAKIRQAIGDLAEIARNTKGITQDAQAIASSVRRGKGTVGALVMDEQLYDDLQELVRDLKHNPWKFFWRE
ncbi:MlaD family protein [Polyangium fumosum]|uniref:MCE family protein n=1 Tax=Polyangium fumosum TaxID=889272 RepID=A0A4U1IX38_9BACT|nr:MlaD family protein [Polyangium fumosum]TKC99100.1 MCE family protein [Polyangium fumosum]